MTLVGLSRRSAESSKQAERTTVDLDRKPSLASYLLVATGRRRWTMTAVLLMCFYTAVSYLYSKNDRGYLFYGSALSRNENGSVTPTATESAIHRIAPLVVQYGRDGTRTWSPPLQSIGRGNLSSTLSSAIYKKTGKQQISTKSFLGYIRIKKTASTSFSSFIKRASLRTFDHYLLNDTRFMEQLPKDQAGKPNSGFTHCIFGESSPTLHDHQQQNEEQAPNSCIHTDYENLVSQWAQSLNFLPDVADGPTNSGSSFLVTLHPITIVRDPLDRYISYFRFSRELYPKWSFSLPPEANTMLKEGNLEGFLYLLPQSSKYEHERNKNHHPNVAFQYEYLSRQVDEAISMVRGGTGHDVLPLVNECFDASLYLLTDLYPQFFPGKNNTKAFLKSQAASSNAGQKRKPKTPEELATRGLSPEQPLSSSNQNMTILRQNAKESFLADEYRFYEAAVSQFLRYLVASNVDRPIVDECLQKLSLVLSP